MRHIKIIFVMIASGWFTSHVVGAEEIADFWPFHVGNTWEYRHLFGTYEYLDDGDGYFAESEERLGSLI
jgi:hypothetical protein